MRGKVWIRDPHSGGARIPHTIRERTEQRIRMYAETHGGWAPYLSLDDAHKLDEVRDALRRGDIRTALRLARVFSLTPLSA